MTKMQELLNSGSHAMADIGTFDNDGNLRGVHKRAPAAVARHSIRELEAPRFISNALHSVFTPQGTSAGKASKLSDTVLAGSRVFAAGARPIIIPTAPEPVPSGASVGAFYERASGFDVIEAAPFVVVADGSDLTDSPMPVHRSRVHLDTMPALGVRIPLTRAEQKSYRDGLLADTAMAGIALGIARALDATLLAAITATTPGAFTIGAAAAAGFEFPELRALVGTAGAGAVVGQAGTLRAGGILAELTPDAAGTLVGAFNRAAVAISEDIALIAERINVKGDLVLTAWINCQPLVPMPGAFWTVGA